MHLIAHHAPVLRGDAALDHGVVGIALQSGHEENPGGRQFREPGEVGVALVEDEDRARQKRSAPAPSGPRGASRR